jgi:hypothetical protein
VSAIIQNVNLSVFCAEKRNKKCIENHFNNNFSVPDTIFYRKSLELTKNYHQKLIAPNGLLKIKAPSGAFNKYII